MAEWEVQSAKIKSLRGKHTRKTFNKVYEEEAVSKGQFFLETPDKGRIDLQGVKPDKNAVSNRTNSKKAPYKVVAGQSERWICTGDEIVMVNEADKSFEVLPIPADQQGENIIHSPLPFLFGMKADEARERFEIFIGQVTGTEVYLTVYPLEEQDRVNYSKAQIILDRTVYLPKSVRLIDAAVDIEYEFEAVKINEKGALTAFRDWIGGDEDIFHPKLKGYKIVVHPPTQEGPPRSAVVPASRVDPGRLQ